MTFEELKNKKIAILGMGVNNTRLADYLKRHRVNFQVFDHWDSPAELTGKIDDFDMIFRTPGLPFLSPPIQQAKRKGVVIYSQTKLFFDLCPCPIIGVTGTKGKGTTATLIYKILKEAKKNAWLSGNIGEDPFDFFEQISPNDLVVLELSSFQLQDLHKSPHIAVVLKITSDHLDHHENTVEYVEAKKPILSYQTVSDFAVLNFDQDTTRNFASLTKAKIFWNSINREVLEGSFLKKDKIMLKIDNLFKEIMKVYEVKLLGRFNLENITAAIAAAAAAGITEAAILKKAVCGFEPLPHRLEFVTEIDGAKFYNDSFSTTPETAIAAFSAFNEPLILIVGGSEKKSEYQELARAIAKGKVLALIAIGVTGPKIARLAKASGFKGQIIDQDLDSMDRIVVQARKLAQSGDVVLLSPASASFDMFANYKQRGELFKKFVHRLK